MKAKKIAIYGEASRPGVWVYVAKVSRFNSYFIYVGKTGFKAEGIPTSPLQRLTGHLNQEEFFSCISTHIERRGWTVAQCHFELWCYGPLEDLPACSGKNWDELNAIALQVESCLASFIKGADHEVVGQHGDAAPAPDSEEPRYTANQVLAEILPDLNTRIRIMAEVDDSPDDDSPEDDSPEDDSPDDDSPEDDSPEDDSPDDSPEDDSPGDKTRETSEPDKKP